VSLLNIPVQYYVHLVSPCAEAIFTEPSQESFCCTQILNGDSVENDDPSDVQPGITVLFSPSRIRCYQHIAEVSTKFKIRYEIG
jgi:hypothetical protein